MTHNEIVEIVTAHGEKKPLERRLGDEWQNIGEISIHLTLRYILLGYRLRVKPEPAPKHYRPWELDEVPIGRVVVSKSEKVRTLITGARVLPNGRLWLRCGLSEHTAKEVLSNYDMLPEVGDVDLLPCGVEINLAEAQPGDVKP